MRGWFGDFFRSITAPWYWNARKTLFALRGRRDQCPCHNPSDSGTPGETRCEAVTYWSKPNRFATRICPLLVKNAAGEWRCNAGPAEVRSFWLRQAGLQGGAVAVAVLLGALALWGTMRAVGFQVSLRQIIWPPAWHELTEVRARFFLDKSRQAFAEGNYREAANSLVVAFEMNPNDYEIALTLAEFFQSGRPRMVDPFFQHLFQIHPDRRADTARIWYQSLLQRGSLDGLAALALRQLTAGGEEAPVWTHALIFAVRFSGRVERLAEAAAGEKVPVPVRELLQFETRLRQTTPALAVRLLQSEPLPQNFPYALVHRVERLIEFGAWADALDFLQVHRSQMSGRDLVRLALAAHAVGRNWMELQREAELLLGQEPAARAAALDLLAQHLVVYPNDAILVRCIGVLKSLPNVPAEAHDQAVASVYSAAVIGGRREELATIRGYLLSSVAAKATFTPEEVLLRNGWAPTTLLAVIRPMSAELNYAILERVFANQPPQK